MTKNLEAILALFENGERRYDEDPAFKAVCDSLKMGLGVYAVLDHQLKEVERLRGKLKERETRIGVLEQDVSDLNEALEFQRDDIQGLHEMIEQHDSQIKAANRTLKFIQSGEHD